MRIPLAATMLVCAMNPVYADWTGDGSFATPYRYTSPVESNRYFIDRRGQSLVDEPPMVIANEEFSGSHYQQVHSREDFKRETPLDPFRCVKHVGTSQDREHLHVRTVNAAGNWKKTFESFNDVSGVVIEFPDPTNPIAIIGVPKYVTMESTIHQDVDGDTGDLTVKLLVENANPNPNNDPPADTWVFRFNFDLPNDDWTASIARKVNDVHDIVDSDMGSWNPYGAGTTVSLAGPTQPLSNTPADWYLDGTNADDAWTLLNNVHNHPGPITFSFVPYTEAFLTHYKP